LTGSQPRAILPSICAHGQFADHMMIHRRSFTPDLYSLSKMPTNLCGSNDNFRSHELAIETPTSFEL
jgi:hypothetical protein